MSHWESHTMNICRIANTNYSNSLVKIMMARSCKLSFLSCVVRGQMRFVRRAKNHFADNFSAAEIIFNKDGQAKSTRSNLYHGALFAPIFSPPCGPKTPTDHDGPKECNPWPSAGAFSFVRHVVVSKVLKRHSLPKKWQKHPYEIPTLDYYFTSVLIDNRRRCLLRCVIDTRLPNF